MGLKIAVITPWMVRCGIFTYTRNLVNALADLGVESYIVRLPRFGAKTPQILQNVVDSIPVDKIDLIHVEHEYGLYQGLEGGFYSGLKQLRRPIVTTMHSIGNWGVDRVVAEVSDKVIVHNKYCAKRFGYSEKTVIIPHGASPTECDPKEESRRSLGIPVEAPIVGYCGFVSIYKGLETLIDAMVEIPDAALLIAGGSHTEATTTPYITDLKQKSLNVLSGRCQWLGWVPDERLPTVYGAMDLVVYPSRFATESGALIMALSYGKAVLTSRLAPFKEKEKIGALMTFKDVKDLRKKIKRLLKDEELRTKMEEGARNYAKSVEWSEIAKRHINLYDNILGR